MKGKLFNLFVVSLMLFGLVGCTSNNKGKDIELRSKKTQSKEVTPSTPESSQGEKLRQLEDQAKTQIPKLKELTKEFYSDITVKVENNDMLVYTYTYKKEEEIKIDVDNLKPNLTAQVAPMMKEVNHSIPDFKIKFVYLNSNKTGAGSILITQNDVSAVNNSTT